MADWQIEQVGLGIFVLAIFIFLAVWSRLYQGRSPEGDLIMNNKTVEQIARMKEQTIGVEVEMNNITRNAAWRFAA